jgi:hypothetical protein
MTYHAMTFAIFTVIASGSSRPGGDIHDHDRMG